MRLKITKISAYIDMKLIYNKKIVSNQINERG